MGSSAIVKKQNATKPGLHGVNRGRWSPIAKSVKSIKNEGSKIVSDRVQLAAAVVCKSFLSFLFIQWKEKIHVALS